MKPSKTKAEANKIITPTKNTKQKPKKKLFQIAWISHAYIYLLLFINGFGVVQIATLITFKDQVSHNISMQTLELSLFLVLANMICLLLLSKKLKIGFWGYCISTVVSIAVAYWVLEVPLQRASLNILGLLFLWGLLNFGGKKRAWNELV